jgi:hypothetical protein
MIKTYCIMIDEEQRKLLVLAMQMALSNDNFATGLKVMPVEAIYPDNQLELLESLLSMTQDIPKVEEECQIIHGFCL